MQVLWAQEATRQLPADARIFINSFHPGTVFTPIFNTLPAPEPVKYFLNQYLSQLMWTPEQASLTMLFLGVEAGKPGSEHRGKYFHPIAQPLSPPILANDLELQKAVWEFSDSLLKRVDALSSV